MKHRLPILLVALAGLLAGCSTIDSRIKENPALFSSLDPQTQADLRKGGVQVGYTSDMVYIALGAPDERSERVTSAGRETVWIYTTTYEEYAGTAHVGYRRVFVRNPRTGAAAVFLEPVYSDVYQDRTEERIRITFRDGRVVAIEQTK
ncbi:MAG: hypothetical protein JWM88_2824 [Verrucomicrobia bacterium]|nr:hypothetical protein [Verrucomicrobiota bacterium]